MNQPTKEQLTEIEEEVSHLRDMLHDVSEHEKTSAERLDPMEKDAIALGATQVSFAIRNAFMKLIQAGQAMTQIHMDLIIPPTEFELIEPGLGDTVQTGQQDTGVTPSDEEHKAA